MTPLLRLAAIDFLNPAPLTWNFEHPPEAGRLAGRYASERMTPAECAVALARSEADLGLIPIAAYATVPDLAIVPGCAIASRGAIRSLVLVLRAAPGETGAVPGIAGQGSSAGSSAGSSVEPDDQPDLEPPTPEELRRIRTVALDTSSRSTVLYTQILFRRFWGHAPHFRSLPPDLDSMMATADAAVLIGDPALRALRDRTDRRTRTGERLRYLDLGAMWQAATGTPWVSAFWAVRRAGLRGLTGAEQAQITQDLLASRDAGLSHIPQLVAEWAPRLSLRPQTVATYLTENISYELDEAALGGVHRFYAEAAALGLIETVPPLQWL